MFKIERESDQPVSLHHQASHLHHMVLLDHPYLSEVKVDVPQPPVSNIISIAYSFPDTNTRIQAHQIISKIQTFPSSFLRMNYKDTLENWFSKCTKVLMNIQKIDDDNCRGYIFEYFFQIHFIPLQPPTGKQLILKNWLINSKFDILVYLLFVKRKFLNQDLFDHLSECLANCFLIPEILNKFDYFLLLNYFDSLYADMPSCRPHSISYLVGILYTILQKVGFDLDELAEKQINYKRSNAVESMHNFNEDNNHNRLFVPVASNKKLTVLTPRKDENPPVIENDKDEIQKSMVSHSDSILSPGLRSK
jgi:hypothetical protein